MANNELLLLLLLSLELPNNEVPLLLKLANNELVVLDDFSPNIPISPNSPPFFSSGLLFEDKLLFVLSPNKLTVSFGSLLPNNELLFDFSLLPNKFILLSSFLFEENIVFASLFMLNKLCFGALLFSSFLSL